MYSSLEDQRQTLRRTTLDLQDWANWRHQQTVQQLQKLKEESNGKQSQECTFAPKIPERINKSAIASNKSTPSKLINRFKKNEQKNQMNSSVHTPFSNHTTTPAIASTVSFAYEDPSPGDSPRDHIPFQGVEQSSSTFPFSDNRNGYPPSAAAATTPLVSSPRDSQRIAELESELQSVQTERDDLLRERKFWLARIQTDNTKLMHLLQNVKSAKEKLLEEINTVEKEKDRLKSLQVDGLESTVLDKVLANSSLSEMNRSQLPSHTRGRAEEVYKTLCTLALRCRANQSAIFEFILTKIEEAESAFLSRKEDLLESVIEELSAIASSSPGNVMAAVNVSKTYPEPLLAALMEKRDEMLRRETNLHEGSNGAVELTEATGIPTDDASIKALMAQNSTLRGSIAQLRKKNAELRNKLQSTNTTNPSSSSSSARRPRHPSSASRGRGSSRDRSVEHKDGGPHSMERSDDNEESSDGDEESDRDTSPPPPSAAASVASSYRQNRSQNNNATPNTSVPLDAAIQEVVEECITTTIRETVRANPLSEKIPITVLQETIQEIQNELKTHITLTVNVSRSRFHWNQRIKEYSERFPTEGMGGVGIPSDVKEEIQSVVKKSLSIPAGLCCLSVYCRCHVASMPTSPYSCSVLLLCCAVVVYSEMISLTMLALTYTHSRISILEGTSPPVPSPAADLPYGGSYEDFPYSSSSSPLNTQPTLYHPNDSLYTGTNSKHSLAGNATNHSEGSGTLHRQRMGTERHKATSPSSHSLHSNPQTQQSQRRTKRY